MMSRRTPEPPRTSPAIRAAAATVAALVAAIACGQGGKAGSTVHQPVPVPGFDLESFQASCATLPPSALALAWADVDALRAGPLLAMVEDPAALGAGRFLASSMGSVHRLALGLYLTTHGLSPLVIVEGDLAAEDLFPTVEEWAEESGTHAYPLTVRGRPALRTGDSVIVAAGDGIFVNGTEGLAGKAIDLADSKSTGSALDADVRWLAGSAIEPGTVLAIAGAVPPGAAQWLEDHGLPSVVGSRGLLAVRTPGEVDLDLGLLPGRSIQPIWFANEVNVFLVGAAEEEWITEQGLASWMEELYVRIEDRGIVVEGSLPGEDFIALVGEARGALH